MKTIARQRVRRSRWLAVASLSLLIGCAGGHPPPHAAEKPADSAQPKAAPPAASSATTAPQNDGVAQPEPVAPAEPPVVRLIDPGAQPRQKLRYKFAVGPAQWVQLDMKMTMGTAGKVTAMPTIRTVIRLDPKALSPEGDLSYEFESTRLEVLKDPTVDKTLISTLENAMAKLVGMKGSATVTPRGISKDVKLATPADAPEEVTEMVENMKQSMDQLYSPLPEEEVGKGAKWEVELHMASAGVHLTQKSEHVLRELRGNSVMMDVTVSQEAPRQEITAKKVAGAKMLLESMHSTGKGKVSLSLDKLVPKSSIDMSVETRMQIETQDAKVPVAMKMQIYMTIAPTTGTKK